MRCCTPRVSSVCCLPAEPAWPLLMGCTVHAVCEPLWPVTVETGLHYATWSLWRAFPYRLLLCVCGVCGLQPANVLMDDSRSDVRGFMVKVSD